MMLFWTEWMPMWASGRMCATSNPGCELATLEPVTTQPPSRAHSFAERMDLDKSAMLEHAEEESHTRRSDRAELNDRGLGTAVIGMGDPWCSRENKEPRAQCSGIACIERHDPRA